jgi:hypothetical protein
MNLESLDSLHDVLQDIVAPFAKDLVKTFKVKIFHCNKIIYKEVKMVAIR